MLNEFGGTPQQLFSKDKYSGSDVKRLCSVLIPGSSDWYISHLCNCAVNRAFGMALRKEKTKNIEVRTIIEQVRKVVEHLHKSSKMRAKFEDLQMQTEGKALKLLQDQAHRWLGTVRVLERFLILWDYIIVHYHRVELRPFPVESQRELLIALFSLLKPVSEIIISAQAANTLSAVNTYQAMCNLYPTILGDNAPFPLRDHAMDGYKKRNPLRFDQAANLDAVTRNTRKLWRNSSLKRFYQSYNGTSRSLHYEMQVLLHPSYRKLACLDRFMEPCRAAEKREKVKSKIFDLALRVAKSNSSSSLDDADTEPLEPYSKKQRTERSTTSEGIWNFSSFEDCDERQSVARRTVEQEIREEIDSYLMDEKVKSKEQPSRKLLVWWKIKAVQYPNLSVVARSVFGHPASSTAIERDFGISGMLIQPSRSRLDAAFVEMQLVLRAHLAHIPAQIPELPVRNDC